MNNNDCKHPALFRSLCVACGKQINHESTSFSNISNNNNNTVDSWKSSLNISGGEVLQLSKDEVVSVQASKLSGIHSVKKLALVLDLDHTLVHAVQIEGQIPHPSRSVDNLGTKNEIHHLPIEEMINGTIKHLIMKKRPYLDKFLEECHSFCQMTIYTAGTRRYAESVAKVIDPTKKYFSDRIVSRSDVSNIRSDGNEKSLERIFPGIDGSRMAVIIDDREDVWQRGNQGEQLILVKPFVHFDPIAAANATGPAFLSMNSLVIPTDALNTISRTHNNNSSNNSATTSVLVPMSPAISLCHTHDGPPGRIIKLVQQFSVESSSLDDQLNRCLEVLQQLHATYYNIQSIQNIYNDKHLNNLTITNTNSTINNKSITVNSIDTNTRHTTTATSTTSSSSIGSILTTMKKRILAGCTITFSGIIPTNEGKPEQHMLWRLAESLGAQVSLHLLPRTTHLISIHLQTQKVKECLNPTRSSISNNNNSINSSNSNSISKGNTIASEVWILHPDWLVYCRWCLAKAHEATFMLNALLPGQNYPNPIMNYEPIITTSIGSTKGTKTIHQYSCIADNTTRVTTTTTTNNNNNNRSTSSSDSKNINNKRMLESKTLPTNNSNYNNIINTALKKLKTTTIHSINPDTNNLNIISNNQLLQNNKNFNNKRISIQTLPKNDNNTEELLEKESPLSALLNRLKKDENNNNNNNKVLQIHDQQQCYDSINKRYLDFSNNNNNNNNNNNDVDNNNNDVDNNNSDVIENHFGKHYEDAISINGDNNNDNNNDNNDNEYNDDDDDNENLNMKGWNSSNSSTDESNLDNDIEEGEIIHSPSHKSNPRSNPRSNQRNVQHISNTLHETSNRNHNDNSYFDRTNNNNDIDIDDYSCNDQYSIQSSSIINIDNEDVGDVIQSGDYSNNNSNSNSNNDDIDEDDDDDFSDFEAIVLQRTSNNSSNNLAIHTSNSTDTLHSNKYYSDTESC